MMCNVIKSVGLVFISLVALNYFSLGIAQPLNDTSGVSVQSLVKTTHLLKQQSHTDDVFVICSYL